MGASILPVTIHNNKIYLLFGKERSTDTNPGWSDFGGGSEDGENLFTTAIRESSEELIGFLGNEKDIRKLLNRYGTYIVDTCFVDHRMYRVHIFPMEYDDMLVKYYNNNHRFLQKKLDPDIIKTTPIFEKTEIKWFCLDDLKKQKPIFRKFYQKVIENILNKQNDIQEFITKKLSKKKKNKTRNIRRHRKNKTKTIKNKK